MGNDNVIAVAVSGGVDSLYCLLKLRETGKRIFAVHGVFQDSSSSRTRCAKLQTICSAFGIPIHIVPLVKKFEEFVISPFRESYLAGLTPNPCVFCNRKIKFGALFDAAHELGANLLATGHYARLCASPYPEGAGKLLAQPADLHKNQSYFLSLVDSLRLEKAIFPLENQVKREIVKHLEEKGIAPPEKKESNDLCFIEEGKYGDFVLEGAGDAVPGPVFLKTGRNPGDLIKIGIHKGLANYTVGQRKGLGIAFSEPLYVVSMNAAQNALFVARKDEAFCSTAIIRPVTMHVPFFLWPEDIFVAIRYRGKRAAVKVALKDNIFQCEFAERQMPPAPGQTAVFYDSDGYILGGGFILG